MSRLRQSWFANLKLRPWMLKLGFALYPPLVGAHIRLERLSNDFRYARIGMRQRFTNSNPWGTHFGGSLFAMTDSIYALMVKQNLGRDYVVWDKSATIDFRKPGRGQVYCEFHLDESLIERIRQETRDGGKCEPVVAVHVFDKKQEVVAEVSKTLYIRKLLKNCSPDASKRLETGG